MNKVQKYSFSVAVLLGLVAVGSLGYESLARIGWTSKVSAQVMKDNSSNPCWFVDQKDTTISYEATMERRNREVDGYPKEIPLDEAIKIFNTEQKCSSYYSQFAPLTDDELLAAIIANSDYGKQGEPARIQNNILSAVLSKRVLPKGSLLVAERGGRVQESPLHPNGVIQAKGVRITLLLGLDKNTKENIPKPEQALIIRKVFIGLEKSP